MGLKRYVQHVSRQGEKWQIATETDLAWRIITDGLPYYLPKSEYRLCEPPEKWVDVTEACSLIEAAPCKFNLPNNDTAYGRYRLRKVQVTRYEEGTGLAERGVFWAFIVEQKVPAC